MHTYAYDKYTVSLVQILSGKACDADYEELNKVTCMMDREGALNPQGSLQIIIIDPGYTHPNAYQRKMIAKTIENFKTRRYVFAIVTDSSLIRGVLTAITWLRPEKPNMISSVHATFEEAARWAELQRGTSFPILNSIMGKARKASLAG